MPKSMAPLTCAASACTTGTDSIIESRLANGPSTWTKGVRRPPASLMFCVSVGMVERSCSLSTRLNICQPAWHHSTRNSLNSLMKPSTKLVSVQGVEAIPYQSRVGYLLGAIANMIDAGGSRLFRRAFGIGLGEVRLVYVIGYEG